LFSINLTGMSFGGMNISNVAMSLDIRGGYNRNLYAIWPGPGGWRCLPSSGVVSDNAMNSKEQTATYNHQLARQFARLVSLV
jgi:hypothetical protein